MFVQLAKETGLLSLFSYFIRFDVRYLLRKWNVGQREDHLIIKVVLKWNSKEITIFVRERNQRISFKDYAIFGWLFCFVMLANGFAGYNVV